MPSRVTLFVRDVTNRVWSYLHTVGYHSDMTGVVDIINSMLLSPIEEYRSIHTELKAVGGGGGLLFHTIIMIFRTQDNEFRSYRLPTGDSTAVFLDSNGIIDTAHPDVAAFANGIINGNICDERGIALVEFIGGYFAYDDSLNQ